METDLEILEAEIAFLPELAADWENEPTPAQLDWRWEWWDLVGRLEALHAAFTDGKLTPDEAERYQALSSRLVELEPLLDRLGFPRPPLALKV